MRESNDKKADEKLADMQKRDKQIRKLARLVNGKKADIAEQESKIGIAKATLDETREVLHAHERALQELQEELENLALGKNSERLPFKEPEEEKPAKPAAPVAPSDPTDWRSMPIAALVPKLSPGKLKALEEHEPPITTMGQMCDHQEKSGDWWARNIKGFGEKGVEQYQAASDRYFAEHPIPKDEAA